ncbi:MAG: error-prone DNA polymerase, partial [Mesorhizobium sp.]
PAVPDGRRVSVAGLVLVRQRPGKGNAIFLTLEDENSVANVIFWERTFTRFRPIVMGARFVRVTGKLQSESGVIHIVAEKVEDLTPWLTVLLEEMPPALPAPPDIAVLSGKAESVMPKG